MANLQLPVSPIYQSPNPAVINPREVIDSLGTIDSNAVMPELKLLERVDLKSSHHSKNIFLLPMMPNNK